ncbi:hypothetical protein RUM44_011672 [Polyplax serrata]|uniref:Cilia- and flagella-associated protein 57 n=1 Tax=Polyplax serrata TaxID=468196 RepID=A0ABR1ASG6_POLSC
MSLPTLSPRIILGHRFDVKKNVHYITDTDILYPCGVALVIQNFTKKTQKNLPLPEKTINVRLLLLSPKRSVIAVLGVTREKDVIHIFDVKTLKRVRTLSIPPEAAAKKFESACFSHDERFVMTITGDPDWMVLGYNWERGKIETTTKANYLTNPTAPVREVVCSPVDTSTIAIFGAGIFRLLNMQETVWRQYGFQKAENYDIESCCFLTGDRILCGTKDGLLLIIDLGELKYIFEADVVTYINVRADKEEEFVGAVSSATVLERAQALEDQLETTDLAVRALTPLTNGFAYACRPGLVHFFEKIAPHKYKKRNIYEIKDKDFRKNPTDFISSVYYLAVNKSETEMIATTKRSQLYDIKLWGPEMDIAGIVAFKHCGQSLHTGPIGDLALCYWKPIFMTFGVIDRTIRIWNYLTLDLEMTKQYQEDIHSVSLHPTGLYAAIGFSDKLRFMTILIDDLQVTREIPIRECPKSAFSLCGHLLAAVNRNVIQIISVITFQILATLKGHSSLITSLEWTTEDKKLISCGLDGAIYEWDLTNFKRTGEIVNKGIAYWDIAVHSTGTYMYAVGSDDCIKEIKASNIIRAISLELTSVKHIVLSRSNMMMFISAGVGIIASVKVPIEERPETSVYKVHSAAITQMKLTMEDKTFITCSETGTICIWDVLNVEGKTIALDKNFSYFNEILISKTDLEEKLSTIRDLTQRTYELEMEHAYQMRHTETVYKEKLKDIQSTYTQAIDELKEMQELIEANHNTELYNISSDMNVMKERHEAAMLEMEAKYNAELIEEYAKVLKLEDTMVVLTKEYEGVLKTLRESKEKTISELKLVNESKLYNLTKMVEEAREDINKEVREHEAITAQIEDDNDREIETLKSRYEKIIKGARESNIRLKGETGVLKKKIISSQKEIELIQMEIIHLTDDQNKLKQNIKVLEREILDLKKEINERDLRIQDKEKRIYDLKRKDQEYERYKFVLNYKIKELKNQIEPRDKEIKDKKEQISKMEIELDDLQKMNLMLDDNLNSLREKLANTYKSLHIYKRKYKETLVVIKKVKTDIYLASGYVQNYKDLKDSIKKLHIKYITEKDFSKARKGDEECLAELQRQKTYLQGIVKSLEIEVEKSKYINYGEGMIYMEMNWGLMEEIYKIRKKLKAAQSKVLDIETLICVKLTKTYSPREAQKLLQTALTSEEDIHEEWEIKMEDALSKAALMAEEVESLSRRVATLENAINQEVTPLKKRKMRFDV